MKGGGGSSVEKKKLSVLHYKNHFDSLASSLVKVVNLEMGVDVMLVMYGLVLDGG